MAELLNLLILYTISNIMRRLSFPSHYITIVVYPAQSFLVRRVV